MTAAATDHGLIPVVLRRLIRLRSAAGDIVELRPGMTAQLPAGLAQRLLVECAAVVAPAPEPPAPVRELPPWPPENPASLPTICADGALNIPFDAPARFRWWQGGQSAEATRAELVAASQIAEITGKKEAP
ncbi:hypothetical protein [Desulfuromonas thiophila]|uniref:hypothetical protein n=1 Tax=Desulfuromonas thiophila TaxID=57664 RepID=UPI0024A7B52D|nr:hypothetical protein [Desulfuromonas thiophila]